MATDSPIPFHIEVRRLYGSEQRDDIIEHELGFGVVGIDRPTRMVITSDFYRSPVITEHRDRGQLELPDHLVDSMAIKCFKLMVSEIVSRDGESGWWTMRDVSRWIRRQFAENGEQILTELSRHVTPGWEVRDVCLVADDDAI
jgi:hypothetical protein